MQFVGAVQLLGFSRSVDLLLLVQLGVYSVYKADQLISIILIFKTHQRVWSALRQVHIPISSTILKISRLQKDVWGIHWLLASSHCPQGCAKLWRTRRSGITHGRPSGLVCIHLLTWLQFAKMADFHLGEGLSVGFELSLRIQRLKLRLILLFWLPGFGYVVCSLFVLLLVSIYLVVLVKFILLDALELL